MRQGRLRGGGGPNAVAQCWQKLGKEMGEKTHWRSGAYPLSPDLYHQDYIGRTMITSATFLNFICLKCVNSLTLIILATRLYCSQIASTFGLSKLTFQNYNITLFSPPASRPSTG